MQEIQFIKGFKFVAEIFYVFFQIAIIDGTIIAMRYVISERDNMVDKIFDIVILIKEIPKRFFFLKKNS